MLVMSRKKNEGVSIDDGRIEVTIVQIRGDRVRLGITAPPDAPVQERAIGNESGEAETGTRKRRPRAAAAPREGGPTLIISRRPREGVAIGQYISVWVVEIRNGKVRLGFESPGEISIYRKEVFDAIERNNRAALERDALRRNTDAQ